MQHPLPTRPVPFFRGPSEAAFAIEPITISDNTAQSAMGLGTWALHEDGSAVHQGATGVLIDDVTAYAVLSSRGADQWAVTSEISVDFHAPVPVTTQRLSCHATADFATDGWGHSSGQLQTDNGELVATVGQRMRFFPGDDSPHRQAPVPSGTPSWLRSLDDQLQFVSRQGTRSELRLNVDPGMRNPLSSLHGGVSLGFSELAARLAWENSDFYPGDPFRTSSIRMSYLRPGALGGDFQVTVDIVHSSRSIAIAEVRLHNTHGSAITFGLVTLHRISAG